MTRPYVQRARAEAAARTRREILDAARTALVSADRLDVAIGEVAAAAGVARSTIYIAFGSRAGLIAALTSDALERGGLATVIGTYRSNDPVEAVEASLRANCRMYAAEHALLARLAALAAVDPDASGPIGRLNDGRSAAMSDLAARLEASGRLAPGLSVERAADVLSVLTAFGTFDELHARRGLDAEACADVLVAIARSAVIGTDERATAPA